MAATECGIATWPIPPTFMLFFLLPFFIIRVRTTRRDLPNVPSLRSAFNHSGCEKMDGKHIGERKSFLEKGKDSIAEESKCEQ
jgi:hypothetical protein